MQPNAPIAPWQTSTPYTAALVERFNNTTHFPTTTEKLNSRFAAYSAELEEAARKQLARYGIKDVDLPVDVHYAIARVLRAEYQFKLTTVRAREIAPPVSMVGPANYLKHARPERADKMERLSYERVQHAEEQLRLALGRHSPYRAVSSDDPEAIEKLEAKIKKAEQLQARMIDANRVIRKRAKLGDDKIVAALVDLGFTEADGRALLTPDFAGRIGYPSYATVNNNANIRRMEVRVEQLKRRRSQHSADAHFDGGKIVDNVDGNRIQVIFEDKPDAAMRSRLKAGGFKWSPSAGAWQRGRMNYTVRRALEWIGMEVTPSGASEACESAEIETIQLPSGPNRADHADDVREARIGAVEDEIERSRDENENEDAAGSEVTNARA